MSRAKKSDPQDPRKNGPRKNLRKSNSSIATYCLGSVGIRSHSIFDGLNDPWDWDWNIYLHFWPKFMVSV